VENDDFETSQKKHKNHKRLCDFCAFLWLFPSISYAAFSGLCDSP
jgi:hypothetical protein